MASEYLNRQDRNVISASVIQNNFEKDVEIAIKSTSAGRKARLIKASKKPEQVVVISTAYKRNPDVVAEVLERANGHCEYCECPAPFIRVKDGSPYLEVHHITQLADDGDDSVENAIALCPNCHRKIHFGINI
jgi:5-methylcytosine-specific restriction protein A